MALQGYALLLLLATASRGDPIAGPFRVIPDHFDDCPPELLDYPFTVHFRGVRDRVNHDLWYYWANYTTSTDFSDEFNAKLTFASWSARGGWKDNAQVMKFRRLCTTIKTYMPNVWKACIWGTYGTLDRDCPFPPGTYRAHNISTDLSITLVPAFFYGKWRLDAQMIEKRTGKSAACVRAYLSTVPKYVQPPASASQQTSMENKPANTSSSTSRS